MTKNILLAATALTALAATAANAQSGYTLNISNVDGTAFNAVEIADYTLASELDFTGGIDAFVEFELVPSLSAILPSGNALLDVTITGGVFGDDVTAAAVIQGGGCAPTRSIVSGGADDESTVQFLLSDLTGCDNGAPILLRIPVELVGDDVSIATDFRTEGGTGIDGRTESLAGAISFESAFAVVVEENDGAETVADVEAIGGVYTALTVGSDPELGTVELEVDDTVFVELYDLAQDGEPADFSDIDTVEIAVTPDTGSFAGLNVFIDGVDTLNDDDLAERSETAAANSEVYDIDVTATGGVIEGGTFSVDVDLIFANLDLADESFSGDINPVTLGGTNFVAPWLAINSGTTNATLRIANGDDETTGPLILTLLSWNDGVTPTSTTCDDTDLAKLDGIDGNGFVSINSTDLRTCFGEDVTNGDVRVTIQGGEEDITAKARLTRDGVTSEISLGRLGETGETF